MRKKPRFSFKISCDDTNEKKLFYKIAVIKNGDNISKENGKLSYKIKAPIGTEVVYNEIEKISLSIGL